MRSLPLVATIAATLALAGVPAPAHAEPRDTAVLEEDQAGWDCRTMGDRACGAGVVGGPAVSAGQWVCGDLVAPINELGLPVCEWG